MVKEGTMLQGAGVQKASIKETSGRESSDIAKDSACSKVPTALERKPHVLVITICSKTNDLS